jgi:antibiotic biosynthesis monooxygenase (ABM) superfamily enzyme
MIRFWFRELMGWLLVVLGLYLFVVCLALLLNPEPSILEAPVISVIGIVVFRGGIHLLKVAVAARIAMQTLAQPAERPPAEKRKSPDRAWDW